MFSSVGHSFSLTRLHYIVLNLPPTRQSTWSSRCPYQNQFGGEYFESHVIRRSRLAHVSSLALDGLGHAFFFFWTLCSGIRREIEVPEERAACQCVQFAANYRRLQRPVTHALFLVPFRFLSAFLLLSRRSLSFVFSTTAYAWCRIGRESVVRGTLGLGALLVVTSCSRSPLKNPSLRGR